MSGSNEELDDHILERFTVQQLLGKGVQPVLTTAHCKRHMESFGSVKTSKDQLNTRQWP